PVLSIISFFLFNTEVGRDLIPDNFFLKQTASMTTKDSSVTPIEVLRDITLTDLRDNSTFKASTIWQNGPALILVVEYMKWGITVKIQLAFKCAITSH